MAAAIAVILAVALFGALWFVRRREAQHLAHAQDVLRASGWDGVIPDTIDAVLDRLDAMELKRRTDPLSPLTLAALDQIGTAVVVADPAGEIVLRNRAAQPYATARHGDAIVEARIRASLVEALNGGGSDEEIELSGNPVRRLLVVASPLRRDDELLGAIVLVDDVSEQHRLDAVRRDFVANVSHELRTPVGALSLLAETLEGVDDPETIQRLTGRIQHEADRLAQLIDDLLDLSRIDGGIGAHIVPLDLRRVLESAGSTVAATADDRNIDLVIDAGDMEMIVEGDESQLISAVTNLLDNALKYTDPGGRVEGRLVTHGTEAAIAVIDTGIGIPERDVRRIFERFYRVDRGRSTSTGGTGLGLSIVRHIAVNHHGRVEVVSQEGVGSTFTLILPLRDPAPVVTDWA